MELYDMELEKARVMLAEKGRDPSAFNFEREYLEPEPDGGGMFTVQYLVTVQNTQTEKGLRLLGGIGNDWVGHLRAELAEGSFD